MEEVLLQEIEWHKNNRGQCHEKFEDGFIAGLEHALFNYRQLKDADSIQQLPQPDTFGAV